jgi:peptidoglycan/xylan/chitin deacetylase (PgdA/CDA1 family)
MPDPRLSVALTVDFDALSSWIARGEGATEISRGEFDAIAVPRILDLFARCSVRTTFFIPGHTALAYPDLVKRVAHDGHEIAHHGWVHENAASLDADAQRVIFERGFAALDLVAGVRPVGYRAAGVGADFGTTTVDLLQEFGFAYDSSCSGTDFTPYYVRRGDQYSKDTAYVFGTPIDIVEIPVAYALDDWQLFEFRGAWTARQATPQDVGQMWREEFDYAYEHCPGGIYDIALHPQSIGRGHRLVMLEQLIEHMASHDGVVFEPMGVYADRWRKDNPLQAWLATNPIHARPGG